MAIKRIKGAEEALFGAAVSSADANRFYSVLLDARASSVSETMFDVAEKLMGSEKENAKLSLDKLWSLKKTMQGNIGSETVDLLIKHYQEKINTLRNKEEHLSQISRDSRKLLEEKRKKDSEVATVKQELSDCTRGIAELTMKQNKLSIREQELTLIGEQLRRELQGNENEIVNGLYEIILAQQGIGAENDDRAPVPGAATAPMPVQQGAPKQESSPESPDDEIATAIDKLGPAAEKVYDGVLDSVAAPVSAETDTPKNEALYKQVEKPEAAPYPKSVVKTTKGRVIGEYYYDTKVYKNKRHYILNSRFFVEQLSIGVGSLQDHFDVSVYSEMVQMVQDSYKRITENPALHFEISTNEILNDKSLKDLWHNLKAKTYDDIVRFCSRLRAKIDSLGQNYTVILREQMERLVKD
jgi:hypothetical protein